MKDPRWGGQNPHDPTDGGRWGESHVDRGDYVHHSIYRGDSRISWNTENGDYIPGSGHTSYNNGNIQQWDTGEQDLRR